MTTTAVKRACDACHRRKVKCDGVAPCRNCSASQLACTYNAIPQKKGPKGSRAKVINELKETQRQSSLTARLQAGLNGAGTHISLLPTPRLLSKETLKACLDFFFDHMYPTMPILDRARLEQEAMYMEQNVDTYCLITALCALVCLQPGMVLPPPNDPFGPDGITNVAVSSLLVEETLRVRKGYDYIAGATPNTICTSYFLYAIQTGLELHDRAWFYLREATTLAHLARMNEEQSYVQFESSDPIDAARRRRIYWLLFVSERAAALQHRRPLTLTATINLPPPQEHAADPFIHNGTKSLRLVGLFRGFDDALLPLWNKARAECSDTYISSLDKQLQEVLPPYLNDTQAQLAEMSINQQWLKHKAWSLSVANGNSTNTAEASYADPIHELLPMASQLPGNLGLHGLTLCEHLFNVANSLADMLSVLPAPRTPFTPGPQDQLRKILNVVTLLRSGDHRFLPLLLMRVTQAIPKLTSPMLQNVPETAQPAPACDLDIFGGFGASTICPPGGVYTDFDNKFAVARFNDMTPSTDSGSSAPTQAGSSDMSSPFGSSSSIMSPGMEMQHTLPAEFTSMPEMVMSPISHAPPTTLGTPGPMSQQTPHPQHTPISAFPNQNPQMQGLNSNNVNTPAPSMTLASQMHLSQRLGAMNNGLSQPAANPNMMARAPAPPQRSSSFAMGLPQIRTVGDFHALQRANTDMNHPLSAMATAMSPLGTEHLDFNTLPR